MKVRTEHFDALPKRELWNANFRDNLWKKNQQVLLLSTHLSPHFTFLNNWDFHKEKYPNKETTTTIPP